MSSIFFNFFLIFFLPAHEMHGIMYIQRGMTYGHRKNN
nr:MAG TPA: hypothetical protein [Caudoviricetes sp.]